MRTLPAHVVALILTACTTVDTLKPGVSRGVRESSFMKTTEGLSLTVTNRSYDEVWAAADAAMRNAGTASVGVYSGRLKVVTVDTDGGVIRSEEENFLGFTRSVEPSLHVFEEDL